MTSEIALKTVFLILVFLAALLEASGDIILKKWALDGKHFFFILGLIVYFTATVIWAFSLKYEFLSKAISIVTILNLIIVVLVGILYFKEDLSLINKLGILLGIVSVVLIEI
jgi:multidrug transporter EmrE-like cation transporter